MNVDKLFCKDNNDVDIFLLIIWNLLWIFMGFNLACVGLQFCAI
jgi:hypothetical protein